MLEQLKNWLEKNESTTFWILNADENKRISFISKESNDELLIDFEEQFVFLPDGKYVLKASKSANDFRNAKRVNFSVGEQQKRKMASNLDYESIEKIREDAFLKGMKQGREMARIDMLEKEVSQIKETVNKIILVLKNNTDSDPDNDFDLKEMFKPIMQTAIEKGASKLSDLEF